MTVYSSIEECKKNDCNFLDLSDQNLKRLSESIDKLKNLESLDVRNNKLQELPKSISNLKHLEELALENNELTYLPESIGNLKNLNYLNIENNNVTKLPKSLDIAPKLKFIFIEHNPVEKKYRDRMHLCNVFKNDEALSPYLPHILREQVTSKEKSLIKMCVNQDICEPLEAYCETKEQ